MEYSVFSAIANFVILIAVLIVGTAVSFAIRSIWKDYSEYKIRSDKYKIKDRYENQEDITQDGEREHS